MKEFDKLVSTERKTPRRMSGVTLRDRTSISEVAERMDIVDGRVVDEIDEWLMRHRFRRFGHVLGRG